MQSSTSIGLEMMDLYIKAVIDGKNPKVNEIISLYSIVEFGLIVDKVDRHYAVEENKVDINSGLNKFKNRSD